MARRPTRSSGWVKDRFVLGQSHFQRRYEPIWYGWSEGGKSSCQGRRDLDDVWELPRPSRSPHHPTTKLVELALEARSDPGARVLDPFLGSSSTLIAAERRGRACSGIELDPGFSDVIVARWEAFTSPKAEKADMAGQQTGLGTRPPRPVVRAPGIGQVTLDQVGCPFAGVTSVPLATCRSSCATMLRALEPSRARAARRLTGVEHGTLATWRTTLDSGIAAARSVRSQGCASIEGSERTDGITAQHQLGIPVRLEGRGHARAGRIEVVLVGVDEDYAVRGRDRRGQLAEGVRIRLDTERDRHEALTRGAGDDPLESLAAGSGVRFGPQALVRLGSDQRTRQPQLP